MSGEMEDAEGRCIQIALYWPFNTQPGDESVGVEFEQDLSIPIGFRGTLDRLLELGALRIQLPIQNP